MGHTFMGHSPALKCKYLPKNVCKTNNDRLIRQTNGKILSTDDSQKHPHHHVPSKPKRCISASDTCIPVDFNQNSHFIYIPALSNGAELGTVDA